jgi:hypothetical protein
LSENTEIAQPSSVKAYNVPQPKTIKLPITGQEVTIKQISFILRLRTQEEAEQFGKFSEVEFARSLVHYSTGMSKEDFSTLPLDDGFVLYKEAQAQNAISKDFLSQYGQNPKTGE